MRKQVLDVEQMKHLQELGINTDNASAVWINPDKHVDWDIDLLYERPMPHTNEYDEFIPAYTLQDVLELLPGIIEHEREKYILMIDVFNKAIHYFRYTQVLTFIKFKEIPMIDAAYEMLCWCIENGYVKTGKEGGK